MPRPAAAATGPTTPSAASVPTGRAHCGAAGTTAPTMTPTGPGAASRDTNSLERLNKEIRRRTDVVGIRPAVHPASSWTRARRAARRVVGLLSLHERRVDREGARRSRRPARGGDRDRGRPTELQARKVRSVSDTTLTDATVRSEAG